MLKKLTHLLFIAICIAPIQVLAQEFSISPIWGASSIGSASLVEPISTNIWNEKPEQAVNPIWGNPVQHRTSETRIRITQRMDTLGNIVRDTVKTNPDSSAAGSVDVSYTEAPPPPDDPTDAPLDNGICLLLAIGLVHGYNLFGRKKTGKKTATRTIHLAKQ